MKIKVGDRVRVYGPCTAMDWHDGRKYYKVIKVDSSDGSVAIEVSEKDYWSDSCEVHERQCVVKQTKKGETHEKPKPRRKNITGKRVVP